MGKNRFLVFMSHFYYPSGGWRDFKEAFETLEEAETYAASLNINIKRGFWELVDVEDRIVVRESEKEYIFPL